jgi:outer membrane lipoprotein-sorting protein
MRSFGYLAILLLFVLPVNAQESLTADAILKKMDQNLVSDKRTATIEMTVVNRGRTRTFVMESFSRGETESAIKYIKPARERGTKMLKKDNELWMYLPAAERVQKISGHLLRQGMMGSDVSYEDMLNSEEMADAYRSTLKGDETFDGHPCYKIEMVSKEKDVAYPKRMMWVDKELYIPLKQELFALSGTLLKSWEMKDIKTFGDGRRYPATMIIKDHLKKNSSTTMTFTELKFNVDFEMEVFSQRWLKRR